MKRYIFCPLRPRSQMPSGPGSCVPVNAGAIIETDDAGWVDRMNAATKGADGLPALRLVSTDTPAKGEPSALYAASEPEAGASADLPDLSELAAAKVVKLAQSLGYPGERRKPDALEFLSGQPADKVAAALADLLDD